MLPKYLLGGLALLIPAITADTKCTGTVAGIASYIAALPAAQSFCSSKYPVPPVTLTTTAPVVTTTSTVATSYVNTTVATVYVNTTVSTSTITFNTTNIVTATTTTTFSTNTTTTTTTTTPVTTTETDTSTVTTTSTATVQVYSAITKKKRFAPQAMPQPAFPVITSSPGFEQGSGSGYSPANPVSSAFGGLMSAANAAAGSICTCIETPRSTTVTVTPTSTKYITATSTVPVTATSTNYLTDTTSTTLTLITTTTLTVNTTTTTTLTATATATTTITTTTTTNTTTTQTATATSTIAPPQCDLSQSNGNTQGAGGCSSNCFCDTAENGNAYCTDNEYCQNACKTDADCGVGRFCTTSTPMLQLCGQPTCEAFDSCTSTYSPSGKRSLKAMLGMGTLERAGRVSEARSAWYVKRNAANCTAGSRLCLSN